MKAKLLMAGVLAIGLYACTTDDNLGSTGNLANEGITYMQFRVQLPTATRSTTTSGDSDDYAKSSEGIEIGQNTENKISAVRIVLTDENNNCLAQAESYTITDEDGNDDNSYTVAFESSTLLDYAGQRVKVYAFCNSLYDYQNTGGVNGSFAVAKESTPWNDNYFYMSNSEICYSTLPNSFSDFYDADHAFDLGSVKVERSMARFDYKDGSPTNDLTYEVGTDMDDDNITITLEEMALINISKNTYFLRRVSDNGLNDNAEICGVEWSSNAGTLYADGNYVVDVDAPYKYTYKASDDGEAEKSQFVYSLRDPESWNWDNINSAILENTEDNDEEWNSDNEDKYNDYHIWRYATENTIPGIDNQKKGITTGVVFKGIINLDETARTNLGITGSIQDTIYVFQNRLLGTWSNVEKLAESGLHPDIAAAVQAVNLESGKIVYDEEVAESNDISAKFTWREALAECGFTGYSPVSDGQGNLNYYAYYYYWNRHNDNNNQGYMGPMEFDVVRNNVYKLSVTDISKFGHPDPTTDDPDPDPEDPDDPDETLTIYATVSVEVIPWVVRVNDITF